MPQPKDKDWLNGYKEDSNICCLQETHLKTGDTYRLKVKGWKKIFHANRDQKKAGVAILILSHWVSPTRDPFLTKIWAPTVL